ncbi:M16 family metallopeptidase [Elioraea rosea]|uniref:M16 family metallopeptidase n=1 Tax=Elioraea rosea TaxID=2492390 RepID=UPI001183A642|nr:pitrilysin family protein [Elioraea rosea]
MSGWSVPVQVVTSPGGIRAWLIEDRSVPVVSLSFAFRGGAALDPAGKEGRATLTAALLDQGAGELDTAAFSTALRDRAVSLNFGAGRDEFTGGLRCLAEETGFAASMTNLALTRPRFDGEAVARVKAGRALALRREAEDPRSIASRAWFERALSPHPFSRPPGGTEAALAVLARDDLEAAVAAQLRRGSLIAAASGAIDAAGLGQMLDETFGGLAAGEAPSVPPLPAPTPFGLVVAERDAPQAVATFGHGGPDPDDPDWEALQVVNWVLGGGGFSSRLTEEIREKRGLTYGIGTQLAPFPGRSLVLGSVSTENPRFGETLSLLKGEWARMAEGGPTEEEVANGKAFLTGSFPLGFTSTGQIANTLVALLSLGRGPDWLEGRIARLDAVTLEDARRAARKLYDPEALSISVAGRPVI